MNLSFYKKGKQEKEANILRFSSRIWVLMEKSPSCRTVLKIHQYCHTPLNSRLTEGSTGSREWQGLKTTWVPIFRVLGRARSEPPWNRKRKKCVKNTGQEKKFQKLNHSSGVRPLPQTYQLKSSKSFRNRKLVSRSSHLRSYNHNRAIPMAFLKISHLGFNSNKE